MAAWCFGSALCGFGGRRRLGGDAAIAARRHRVRRRCRYRDGRLPRPARRDRERAGSGLIAGRGGRGGARRGGAAADPHAPSEKQNPPAPVAARPSLAACARPRLAVAAASPSLGIAVYLAVGSPALPGRPYAARLDAPLEQATAADLVAKRRSAPAQATPTTAAAGTCSLPCICAWATSAGVRRLRSAPSRLLGEFAEAACRLRTRNDPLENGVVGEPARRPTPSCNGSSRSRSSRRCGLPSPGAGWRSSPARRPNIRPC